MESPQEAQPSRSIALSLITSVELKTSKLQTKKNVWRTGTAI